MIIYMAAMLYQGPLTEEPDALLRQEIDTNYLGASADVVETKITSRPTSPCALSPPPRRWAMSAVRRSIATALPRPP